MISKEEYYKNINFYNKLVLSWLYANNYKVEKNDLYYIWQFSNCKVCESIVIDFDGFYLRYRKLNIPGEDLVFKNYQAFLKIAKIFGYNDKRTRLQE
jgi:hypothetical protein